MNIAELRKLMERATPGPWMNNGYFCCVHTHNNKVNLVPVVRYERGLENNGDLIAAAVNALPALLAVVEAAKACNDAHMVDIEESLMDLRKSLAKLEEA